LTRGWFLPHNIHNDIDNDNNDDDNDDDDDDNDLDQLENTNGSFSFSQSPHDDDIIIYPALLHASDGNPTTIGTQQQQAAAIQVTTTRTILHRQRWAPDCSSERALDSPLWEHVLVPLARQTIISTLPWTNAKRGCHVKRGPWLE
jgi:hypothetical protein